MRSYDFSLIQTEIWNLRNSKTTPKLFFFQSKFLVSKVKPDFVGHLAPTISQIGAYSSLKPFFVVNFSCVLVFGTDKSLQKSFCRKSSKIQFLLKCLSFLRVLNVCTRSEFQKAYGKGLAKKLSFLV